MSWSSSLPFVLQYAVYLHAKGFSQPDLSEIYLLVLDTTKLPLRVRGDFMHDIDLIKKYQPFSDDLWDFSQLRMVNNRGYYFGEYLTEGGVMNGHCVQVSIQKLIDEGLPGVAPWLEPETKWSRWANRVLEIRYAFCGDEPVLQPSNVDHVLEFLDACLDDKQWASTLAPHFLSLKPYCCSKADWRGIQSRFREFCGNETLAFFGTVKFGPETEYARPVNRSVSIRAHDLPMAMPEVRQTRDIVAGICAHVAPPQAARSGGESSVGLRESLDDLADDFAGLRFVGDS